MFFAALQVGGFGMERETEVPRELSSILQATVIVILAAAVAATARRARTRKDDGMNVLTQLVDASIVPSILRALTPVLLAALGGAICAKAGVFNVGLEGFMLVGAFAAVAGSWFTGSAWIGVLAGMLAGAALSAVLAIASVRYGGDEIIVGIALNLLAVGLTAFLLRTVFGRQGTFTDPALQGLGTIAGQTPLTYLAFLLVPVLAVFLRRHVWGFRLQGVGEAPEAARSLGVDTAKYRYGAVLASGLLCGLGGCPALPRQRGAVLAGHDRRPRLGRGRGRAARPGGAVRRAARRAAVRGGGGPRLPAAGGRPAVPVRRGHPVRAHPDRPDRGQRAQPPSPRPGARRTPSSDDRPPVANPAASSHVSLE